MKTIFALCVLAIAFASVFAFTRPGKCPKPTGPSQSFDLERFLGTWYQIETSQTDFSHDTHCTQANYKLDSKTGKVAIDTTGVEYKTNAKIVDTSTLHSTDKSNVFTIGFLPFIKPTKYWVADTDYNNYALVVECTNFAGIFYTANAWILSRNSTLDDGIVRDMKSKLYYGPFGEIDFKFTIQDC
uniref:Apolipo D-like n=1 Tax=Tetranychus evansi TaxID=178897 RepID=A0A3G5APJ1_9ACAR|nr:apolipo D-like [Tetranychus evansi]